MLCIWGATNTAFAPSTHFKVSPRVCFAPCQLSISYKVTPQDAPEVTLYAVAEAGEEIVSTQPTRDLTVVRSIVLGPGQWTVGLAFGGQLHDRVGVQVLSPAH